MKGIGIMRVSARPLSATVSPTSADASVSTSSGTTNSVTATATGGTGGYTYAWSIVTTQGITVNSPTAATTTFSKGGMTSGQIYTGTATCAVTSGGTTVNATPTIPVTIERL